MHNNNNNNDNKEIPIYSWNVITFYMYLHSAFIPNVYMWTYFQHYFYNGEVFVHSFRFDLNIDLATRHAVYSSTEALLIRSINIFAIYISRHIST